MARDVTSGFIAASESDYLVDAEFTMREEVSAHGPYRMVKAMRYGRWYLLKGLAAQYAGSLAYRTMLHKEFEIAVSLDHPNIAQTITFEDVPGIGLCIVMEWIDGESLDEWLPGKSRRDKEDVLKQILSAVEYMHQRQVVHRDLKPSNVMVTRNGMNAKLIDFGLSDADNDTRMKHPGGTPGYVSPEQRQAKAPDQRNDIYSLGCIISDMHLDRSADRIARKCKREIDRRYADIRSLRSALHRRHWPKWTVLGVLIVALLSGAVIALQEHGDEVEFIPSKPEIHADGRHFVRFGCDTMQFLVYEDRPTEVEVSLGYAPPGTCLHIPEKIVYMGDTLTVTEIGWKTFCDGCFSYVDIPNTVEAIHDYAFYNNGICEIDIPDGVKYIGASVFAKCPNLRKITFGRNVSAISRDVFMGSSLIREIRMKSIKPPLLESSNHYDYSATLYVPRGTLGLYRTAETWELFRNIEEYDLE